jgi:glycosyltransferase involved in cell wall biosynthesis
LKALIEHGHQVRVVAAAAETTTPEQKAQVREELSQQQMDASRGELDGIEVVSVRDLVRHVDVLVKEIREYQPDWVIVSSEDISHSLLREAARSAPGRLIYLAHTPQFFPFGPASWHPDEGGTHAVRSAAAVIVISQAMADYVERHLGVKAELIHPPMYGEGPHTILGNFDSGCIAMINPCAVKGLSLFLSIADSLHSQRFAVLPGWGATSQDLEHIKQRKNIAILPRVRRIEQFLERTKVLLMPSLWLEGFGLIVMEAMLRGVPVIASDSGGLREAKAGTGFVLPVHLIEHYESVFDQQFMPRPILPAQSVEPWIAAIQELCANRERYEQEVKTQKQAAEAFVAQLDRFKLERFLSNLSVADKPSNYSDNDELLANLSNARRELLLKRLKARQANR